MCPSAHTGRLWLSMCVRQHTLDVRGCASVHISARSSLDSTRWPFPWTVWVILAHVGCQFSTHMRCVGDCQHTQDVCGCLSAHTRRPWVSVCVCGCPPAHTGRPWLSVAVRQQHSTSDCVCQHKQNVCVCPCVSVSRHRTFVAVEQYTYQHVGPWTQHADPSRGLFG